MRFLGIGDYNSLGDMYWRLAQDGHDVRVHVAQAEAHCIYAGLLTRVDDWREHLAWVRAAGAEGIIVFESADCGNLADALRLKGYQVVGGSAYGDRLERDRDFGQTAMRDAGLSTAPTFAFERFADGIDFLRQAPGKYVFKFSDGVSASTRNYVGQRADGADVIALLERERMRNPDQTAFVLMQYVEGIEVGIGAYFDGQKFLTPACIDWEHKRFFPGDIGELTGEMGTVVTYDGSTQLFGATLAKLAEPFCAARHCGYVNLNTIVNADGVWPLEFTCRFGYPGFAICDALHRDGWAPILHAMANRSSNTIATLRGYSVGVVLTVPPFPYEYGYAELSKGTPIFLAPDFTEDDRRHLHFGEAEWKDGGYIASGSLGYLAVVTGRADDISGAQREAYARVRKIVVANMRYRNDIGDRLLAHEREQLAAWGF